MFFVKDNDEATRKRNKKLRDLTIKKFAEYEKEICKRMGFSSEVWNMYRNDILQLCDPYNPQVKYAGRGDSRKFTLSSFLVPEPFDNWIYYFHDKFYELIEKHPCCYGCLKDKGDLMMENLMEIKAGRKTVLPEIYKFFVKWFG